MLIAARNAMLAKHAGVANNSDVVTAGNVADSVVQKRQVLVDKQKLLDELSSPRFYMEKSIEVMQSSIAERRKDGKPTPRVGAVIVFPNRKTDTAYRGELREGDHAEYTLIERKHRGDNLTGCILFATLEPCAPGARHRPKLACAERIVNARIRKVYIGIEDPDPTVAGKGIKYLQQQGVEVEMYPRDLQKQIEDCNKEFLSAALDRAKKAEEDVLTSNLSTEIEYVADNVYLEDLSDSLLRKFAYNIGLSPDNSGKFYRQLAQIGILELVNETYRPTGIGYLLFGSNPQLKYPHACINCIFKRVGHKEDIYKIGGSLLEQPEELHKWYELRVLGQIDRSRPVRQKAYDYPYEVVSELVKNAILHRDYTIEGAPIYFELSDDEIIIKSPGLPLDPITIGEIENFSASSLSRNPKIMFVFEAMKLAEQRGFGFDTVRNLRKRYDLPLPIVTYDRPYMFLHSPVAIRLQSYPFIRSESRR